MARRTVGDGGVAREFGERQVFLSEPRRRRGQQLHVLTRQLSLAHHVGRDRGIEACDVGRPNVERVAADARLEGLPGAGSEKRPLRRRLERGHPGLTSVDLALGRAAFLVRRVLRKAQPRQVRVRRPRAAHGLPLGERVGDRRLLRSMREQRRDAPIAFGEFGIGRILDVGKVLILYPYGTRREKTGTSETAAKPKAS